MARRLTVHRWSLFSFCDAVSLNADWAGKRRIWTFERSPRTCLGPQAVFACPLNPLYSHSARRRMERNWRSYHWNCSLRAADSLMMIVSLLQRGCFSSSPTTPIFYLHDIITCCALLHIALQKCGRSELHVTGKSWGTQNRMTPNVTFTLIFPHSSPKEKENC